MPGTSSGPVIVAIAAGLSVAAAKFVAAAATGGASMLAEGVHSLVDSINDSLLLVGRKAYRRPPDDHHPLGHGKELYFWTTVVALVILGAGGGVTIYEGVRRLIVPEPVEASGWNYAVLGIAAALEGYSCVVAWGKFREERQGRGFWESVRASKDPTTATILLEDIAALAGVAVALLGTAASQALDSPYPDATASLAIGVLLAVVAVVLVRESRDLLVGERAEPDLVAAIRGLAESDGAIERACQPRTMHLGPDEVKLLLRVRFRAELSGSELKAAIVRIGASIRAEHPEVRRISLEIESFDGESAGSGACESADLRAAPG